LQWLLLGCFELRRFEGKLGVFKGKRIAL
jgi:hypothetical protein